MGNLMKKLISAVAAGALTLSVAACYTPGERAVGGAAIGGLAGAAIGAAGGAIVGAATTPGNPCPYGTYRDVYGNVYCR
jgi:osmotically inducible lipoprotein OsmB